MSRAIEAGKAINLISENQNICVTIESSIGNGGGSCIAYYVTYNETNSIKHRAVLKEFCPIYLGKDKEDFRDVDNNIIVPEYLFEEYNAGLQSFIKTYEIISDYLLKNFTASNAHTTQIGLFFANNTAYTLTAADYGKSYDSLSSGSLRDELEIALAITKAVEMYHKAGFLHLDIKPQNILVLDKVKDLIKLFDFDSLVSIEQAKKGYHVSETNLFYVPEISERNFRRIGVHTDILEIASILYLKLFGKVPSREQMNADYKYNFDGVAAFKGISPKALYEIEQLFKHTLQVSPFQRYSTTDKLKTQLEKIIELVDSKSPYLINLPKWQPSVYGIGREKEIKDIHNKLETDGFVFIKAMGGLGKSELAKMYAAQYADEYHTVQFCKFSGSLKALVSSISINGVRDSEYQNMDKLAKVKNDILHDCDSHTLLIIDNFNVTYDEFLREFLPADNSGFKVIITTRCEPAQDYLQDKVYELTTLSKPSCQQLFCLHSGLNISDELNNIDRLLEIIECNTLVLVLLSKSIKLTKTSLDEVIEQLENTQMDNISGDVFHEYDYSSIEGNNYNKVFAHLKTIFSMSRLNSVQKELLLCLSLVSNIGIEKDEFLNDCENDSFSKDMISELIAYGWIEEEQKEWISLHPVISDLVFSNKEIERGECYNNLSYSIINQCDSIGTEHIDVLNIMFSYLYHLDKRIGKDVKFRSMDVKLNLANLYYNLYMPKEANQKLDEAEEIIPNSFRYKPRLCRLYCLKGEIENEFGTPDKAIELYNTAIKYCKKTVNCYYDERILSLIGIAECYAKLHNYKDAYKAYVEAYNYVYNDSIKEKINSKFFITDNYGTKDLYHYVPSICDGIIVVCKELQLTEELAKYQEIKSQFETDETELQAASDKAIELFNKGDIKGGTRVFFEALKSAKEEYGEDSPLYKKIEADVKPLLVMSAADDENVTVRPITEGIEFIKEKYGDKSGEYLDYADTVLDVLLEIGELEFAKQLALNCKDIASELFSENSYIFQSFNLNLIYISMILGETISAKNAVDAIDYSFFEAKSETEKLIKKAGFALYNFGRTDIAQSVSENVINLKNAETSSLYTACIILAWINIDSGNLNKAKTFLDSGMDALNNFNDGFIKDEYLFIYYYGLSKYFSEFNDEEQAAKVWKQYIKRIETIRGRSILPLKCRAYCEQSIHLRYFHKFPEAYKSVKCAVELLEHTNNEPGDLIKRCVYGNYAICSMYCQHFDDAYEYIEKYMKLLSDEQKSADKDYLNVIVFFIDALIVNQDKSFYYFIEEAEKVVENGGFQKEAENAMLKNYIGVVLGDYEEKYGLAKNYFIEAKEILDNLNMQENELYKQILANIEYADNKILHSLLKG